VRPDIRRLFSQFHQLGLDIKYSNGNQATGAPKTSRELVITNWDPATFGQLF